jgi:uncharacterized repeat protein (TIGR03803 family)
MTSRVRRGRGATLGVVHCSAFLLLVLAMQIARAAPEPRTIFDFGPRDGEIPRAGLIRASDGNLYGTTSAGGRGGGEGTVFRLTADGVPTTLLVFDGSENMQPLTRSGPAAELVQGADGFLYGTTKAGGTHFAGTAFKISLAGNLVVRTSFDGAPLGYPDEPLVQAGDGNLYGIAGEWIYRFTPAGVITPMVSVKGLAALVTGPDGRVYGTTVTGGLHGRGSAFRFTPPAGIHVIASFRHATGTEPGHLVLAHDGNFYGTTEKGGAFELGTLFRLSAQGSLTALTSLNSSTGYSRATLISSVDGNLYGTTTEGTGTLFRATLDGAVEVLARGGSYLPLAEGDQGLLGVNRETESLWHGSIFRLSKAGAVETVYRFPSPPRGEEPTTLIRGEDGTLYGATMHGGVLDGGTVFAIPPHGRLKTLAELDSATGGGPVSLVLEPGGALIGLTASGSVFRVASDGSLTKLADLASLGGMFPQSIMRGLDGNVYGTEQGGGPHNDGLVFKLAPDGALTTIATFVGTNGCMPTGTLAQGADGTMYGVTVACGPKGYGTVYSLTPGGVFTTVAAFDSTTGLPSSLLRLADGTMLVTAEPPASDGIVLRVRADGTFDVLATLDDTTGASPVGLRQLSDGSYYGVTQAGGERGGGTLFRMTAEGTLSVVAAFGARRGGYPLQPPLQGIDGNLYGTTSLHGKVDGGAVYVVPMP